MNMKSRRTFIKKSAFATAAISMPSLYAFGSKSENNMPKISLAQWSLNRAFFGKTLDPNEFASIAINEYSIAAIDYVNQFYLDSASNEKFWLEMKTRATDVGVESLIMMVDEEEKLGDKNSNKRMKAVEDHYKWVHAAKNNRLSLNTGKCFWRRKS